MNASACAHANSSGNGSSPCALSPSRLNGDAGKLIGIGVVVACLLWTLTYVVVLYCHKHAPSSRFLTVVQVAQLEPVPAHAEVVLYACARVVEPDTSGTTSTHQKLSATDTRPASSDQA